MERDPLYWSHLLNRAAMRSHFSDEQNRVARLARLLCLNETRGSKPHSRWVKLRNAFEDALERLR